MKAAAASMAKADRMVLRDALTYVCPHRRFLLAFDKSEMLSALIRCVLLPLRMMRYERFSACDVRNA
jgi:hypothetical protein